MAAHDELGPFSASDCLPLSTLVNVLGATLKRGASGNRWAERECSAVGSGVCGLPAGQATMKAAASRRTPNQALEIASGTGRQFSIVRMCVRDRSQLLTKAGHSRVDGPVIHIQEFRVVHFCFEDLKG